MTSSPLLPRVKFLLNTGETDRATDDGLATDVAGTDATLTEEAEDETDWEEEEEARIETPPPPPATADTEAFTGLDAADSGLPVPL